jgi:ribonucleotide monophosphatase NagD (HAD superfamily)
MRFVTSGDVTRAVIAEKPGVKVLHLGADRDLSFYEGLDLTMVGEAEAELISCTGLFDDTVETPEDYRALFERLIARGLVMVCANPDLVVERGDTLIYCAGALARFYQELGGRAVLVGKPHAPIYKAAREILAELGGARLLAIGDGLPTDIRGACDNGLDVLFVTGGIHAADFGPRRCRTRSACGAALSGRPEAPWRFCRASPGIPGTRSRPEASLSTGAGGHLGGRILTEGAQAAHVPVSQQTRHEPFPQASPHRFARTPA